ncbi:MAG: pyridoxamine 5'-phosphate oxidase family protein [Chloroflexota bacterium]
MMNSPFHSGELAVQKQAGVEKMAQMVGKSIKAELPGIANAFLQQQSFVILASQDETGQVWSSILTGPPGFLQAQDRLSLLIQAKPRLEDPLYRNLHTHPQVGLLVIEFATRRRMRINGQATVLPNNHIYIQVEQAYGNCPKYIQARELQPRNQAEQTTINIQQGDSLTQQQQDWLAKADTFFIASLHPGGGADASHRGGNSGFISIQDENTLVWPDYAGNAMFNTLGNIAVNPKAGLLVIDFEQGTILQLTGEATIIWDTVAIEKHVGAERLVSYQIDQVIETKVDQPLIWTFDSYSPFNPS